MNIFYDCFYIVFDHFGLVVEQSYELDILHFPKQFLSKINLVLLILLESQQSSSSLHAKHARFSFTLSVSTIN